MRFAVLGNSGSGKSTLASWLGGAGGLPVLGYVGVFKAHVNVGFFHGVAPPDPSVLLQGTGKAMRHVKVLPGRPLDTAALDALIVAACHDLRARLAASAGDEGGPR